MNQHDWMAELFEAHRQRLRTVAYRMLGSRSEADDAVQETWVRLSRADTSGVENLGGWLTTVVGRVCLDMLRSRKSRREHPLDTTVIEPAPDPEHEAVMADSIGLALLVVLETLAPAERVAFVLHDMFGMPFEEIAPIVERTPAATRQLASRARRRVRGAEPDPIAHTLTEQRRVVDAFLDAARNGDFDGLVAILDPNVVFRADRGALGPAVPAAVHGAEATARVVLRRGAPAARFGRPAVVNGKAGVVVVRDGRLVAVLELTIAEGRIAALELVLDPQKLARVPI